MKIKSMQMSCREVYQSSLPALNIPIFNFLFSIHTYVNDLPRLQANITQSRCASGHQHYKIRVATGALYLSKREDPLIRFAVIRSIWIE